MGAATANEGLIVRLEGGKSGRRELHLDGGRPHLPFAVGANGDWKVEAARPGSHVMIAYNGSKVYVGAVGRTEGIEINGEAAEPVWTAPELPAIVSFGEARIVIDQEPPPDDGLEVTTSPAAFSVRSPRPDALTEIADEARLLEALEVSRRETQDDDALARAPTSMRVPFAPSRRLGPPPLPTRPRIRLITRPWDRS